MSLQNFRAGSLFHQEGMTWIELMVAVAILAILLIIGLPMMNDWIQNRHVNVMAESVAAGLRYAQSEAVKANQTVEFVLTTSAVQPAPTNPTAVTLTAGGLTQTDTASNWMVRVQGDATASGYLQAKSASDGADRARISGPAGAIFTPLGRVQNVLNADGTSAGAGTTVVYRILNPFADGVDGRRRCVILSSGGAVKVCDPKAPGGDPRSCPPQITCPSS
jgi:type IV fimbrial biogenesis protein FimT